MHNIKTRFTSFLLTILTVLTLFPAVPAMAAEVEGKFTSNATLYSGQYTGGWDQVSSTTTVTDANGSSIGTVYAGEGVTVFNYRNGTAYIEYSAGSSYKRGYIPTSRLRYNGRYPETDVGIVVTATSTYYSPYGSFRAGSVGVGEYVALLTRCDGWDYIEYNVSGGNRKRAYVPSSCIQHQYGTARNDFYSIVRSDEYTTLFTVPAGEQRRVYCGPNSATYADIGYITQSDNGNL